MAEKQVALEIEIDWPGRPGEINAAILNAARMIDRNHGMDQCRYETGDVNVDIEFCGTCAMPASTSGQKYEGIVECGSEVREFTLRVTTEALREMDAIVRQRMRDHYRKLRRMWGPGYGNDVEIPAEWYRYETDDYED